MGYESVSLVATYMQWFLAVAGIIITIRGVCIIQKMYSTLEDVSFLSVIDKVSNHVKALIILVCIEGIIELVKSYFFHV